MNRTNLEKVALFFYQRLPKYLIPIINSKSIAVWGIRRGGTTFFSELINRNRIVRTIDQPFDSWNRDYDNFLQNIKKKHLPPKDYCQYFNLSDYEREILVDYFKLLEQGKINQYDKTFFPIKKINLYKITNANFLIDELTKEFNFKSVVLTRHPIAQSLSCYRSNWELNYYSYLDSTYVRDTFLSNKQIDFATKIHNSNDIFMKHILNWIFHNIYMLNFKQGHFPVICYEDLLISPNEVKQYLKQFDIDIYIKKINRPSGSRKWSEKRVNEAIKRNDLDILLGRWVSELDSSTKKEIQNILDLFEINIYNSFSCKPLTNLNER